jgi:hypothetical protein
MKVQLDRLAVSGLIALAFYFVVLLAFVVAIALFTGGWYVAAGVISFFVLWALLYRLTEVKR